MASVGGGRTSLFLNCGNYGTTKSLGSKVLIYGSTKLHCRLQCKTLIRVSRPQSRTHLATDLLQLLLQLLDLGVRLLDVLLVARIGRIQRIAGLLLLRQHKPQRMDLGVLHLAALVLLQRVAKMEHGISWCTHAGEVL